MLKELSPTPNVGEWMKARGANPKLVSRVLNENVPFTGLAIVDRLAMDMGLNLLSALTIIPSRQRGAARKMAIDILWHAYVNENDLGLEYIKLNTNSPEGDLIERAALQHFGHKELAAKTAELERQRDAILGVNPSNGG